MKRINICLEKGLPFSNIHNTPEVHNIMTAKEAFMDNLCFYDEDFFAIPKNNGIIRNNISEFTIFKRVIEPPLKTHRLTASENILHVLNASQSDNSKINSIEAILDRNTHYIFSPNVPF